MIHFLSMYIAHVQFRFPTDQDQERKRWKDILKNNLNAKCRSYRSKRE